MKVVKDDLIVQSDDLIVQSHRLHRVFWSDRASPERAADGPVTGMINRTTLTGQSAHLAWNRDRRSA